MLTVPLRFMIAGIAFSLEVLGQWEEADSLHWMDSVLAFISRHTFILQRVYKKFNYISLCFLNESAFVYICMLYIQTKRIALWSRIR